MAVALVDKALEAMNLRVLGCVPWLRQAQPERVGGYLKRLVNQGKMDLALVDKALEAMNLRVLGFVPWLRWAQPERVVRGWGRGAGAVQGGAGVHPPYRSR